jgi:glycosyltransferase involved in cell wall biosynthesis
MKLEQISEPLRIAQIAPLWTSIPPRDYGGIELVVHLLTEELSNRGHEVTLFASGDSNTSAELHAVGNSHLLDAMAKNEAYEHGHYVNSAIGEAISRAGQFDLIHCHLGCDYIPFAELSSAAMLYTVHTDITVDDRWVLDRYPDVPISCLSRSQASGTSASRTENIYVIPETCDFGSYELSENAGQYLVFLGRMGPHKGPVDAIQIAKQVKMPIILAGSPLDEMEKSYFSDQVEPLIDGTDVIYQGPVNHEQKNQLLRNAGALLFPINWREPFGIVMIEAMACGTPVIGREIGSVAEVVDLGVTGFYADALEDLAAYVTPALSLDRRKVRDHAMRRFDHRSVVDEYTALYRKLIQDKAVA